jgi:hypothetical protein
VRRDRSNEGLFHECDWTGIGLFRRAATLDNALGYRPGGEPNSNTQIIYETVAII